MEQEDNHNEEEEFDGTIPMDDTSETLDDLWDEKQEPENADEDESPEGEDPDSGKQDDPDAGEDPEAEDAPDTSDEEDEEDDKEEGGIELELIDGADDALVSNVELLYTSDQLFLDEDKVKEIFDGSEESYATLMEENKKAANNSAIQQVYENLPTRGKDFFDYLIKTNGQGDLDGWLEIEREVRDLSQYNLKELTDDQAKSVLKEDYKQKGLLDKQIKFIIDAHEDNDELIGEASTLIKNKLAAQDAAKAQKIKDDAAAAAAAKQAELAKHNYIVKQIQNTKFSTQKQEELYGLLYGKASGSNNPIIVDTIQNIIKNNPDHLVQLAQLFDGYTAEEGFNLTRLKKQVKTNEVKRTKKVIKRKTKQQIKGGQTRNNKNGNGQSLDDWLGDDEL